MTLTPLSLTLMYVVLAFLLLVLCLATRWARWIKIGMVMLVSASYFIALPIFENLAGWPAAQVPPEKFALLALVVEEPNKEHETKGALYIWVNEVVNGKPVPLPRAYQLAYRKDLHALLSEAMKRNRQGITQIGSVEPPAGGKLGSWLRNAADPNLKIKISDAPSPQLPEK